MTEISERLIAFAVLLQTIEYLQLRTYFGKDGVWTGSSGHSMRAHFWIRLGLTLTAMVTPSSPFTGVIFVILSLSTMVIAARMHGTFNGGSDMMTGLALLCLGLNRLGVPFFLTYLVIQIALSYFVSGVSKLRSHRWRDGSVLIHFALAKPYAAPAILKKVAASPILSQFAAWSVLLFECLFPLAFLNQAACLIFLSFGALFHLTNVYLFGLNRFFWIWVATYPLVYGFVSARGLTP